MPNDPRIIPRDRSADSRDAGARTETREERSPRSAELSDYRPPSQLPDPDPQPGWVFRWVRKSTRGQIDDRNMWERRSEGWEPVSPEEQPELVKKLFGVAGSGIIEIGGLVLCKAPEDRMTSRNKHFEKAARATQDAVDRQLMREQDPRMPILKPERTTRITRDKNFV